MKEIFNMDLNEILNVPQEYNLMDTREKNCISYLMNSGICETSSQIVVASILSDRLCIASKGTLNLTLSPQCIILN